VGKGSQEGSAHGVAYAVPAITIQALAGVATF